MLRLHQLQISGIINEIPSVDKYNARFVKNGFRQGIQKSQIVWKDSLILNYISIFDQGNKRRSLLFHAINDDPRFQSQHINTLYLLYSICLKCHY